MNGLLGGCVLVGGLGLGLPAR